MKRKIVIADAELVAGGELRPGIDPLSVDRDAVIRAEVLYDVTSIAAPGVRS